LSNSYDTPLRFELSPAGAYQWWLLSLHAAAALVLLLLTTLAASLKIVLLLILFAMLYWQWQKLRLLPRRLIQQDGLGWLLEDQDGRPTVATLLDEGYVSRWLIILHFKMVDAQRRSIVILPYMLDKNSFRQLCVYLRMTNLSLPTDE